MRSDGLLMISAELMAVSRLVASVSALVSHPAAVMPSAMPSVTF